MLAAGRGVRMGGETPKTLVPLAGGEPLLHYILRGLALAGVEDLLVVTGHRPRDVEAFVSERWADATFVRNARYASWGNFHTVRLAVDQSPGMELLVVNSDVVVHPNVYRRTSESMGDLVLAVQRRQVLDDEDMRVHVENGRVRGIGKHLKRAHSHGEYAGVSLLRPDAAALYSSVATDLEWSGATTLYYEDVYERMLDRLDVRSAEVGPDEYAEVDVPDDLAAAAAVVDRHRDVWKDPAAATDMG